MSPITLGTDNVVLAPSTDSRLHALPGHSEDEEVLATRWMVESAAVLIQAGNGRRGGRGGQDVLSLGSEYRGGL